MIKKKYKINFDYSRIPILKYFVFLVIIIMNWILTALYYTNMNSQIGFSLAIMILIVSILLTIYIYNNEKKEATFYLTDADHLPKEIEYYQVCIYQKDDIMVILECTHSQYSKFRRNYTNRDIKRLVKKIFKKEIS